MSDKNADSARPLVARTTGTRGEGLGTRPGPLQALSADREASQRRKGRERKQAGVLGGVRPRM